MRSASLLGLSTMLLTACAAHMAPVGTSAAPRAPSADRNAAAQRSEGSEEAPRFENPGGMWMPSQIGSAAHAKQLRALGLEIDPAELAEPTSGVLGAVVSLGGCSASFVSPEGLVATNHHCATGALQHNATPEANLVEDGFLAKTRADEKSNGPQARILVTQRLRDVTADVRGGIEAIKDDEKRAKTVEQRQKALVAACEKDRPGVRCAATSFYEGQKYFLVEQLEIRDVRLVWAPPASVGNFGGEIDNWRWPRHTGDVALFRAYVGKDGRPADYASDNVPYTPPHHLRIAAKPLHAGDLVFVAGYPGRTTALRTRAEVERAVTWAYPRRIAMFDAYLARLEQATAGDPAAKIRATSYVRRFANARTNTKGQLEGLTEGGLAAQKADAEAKLRAALPEAAQTLDAIEAVVAESARFAEDDAMLDELAMPRLVSAAITIVRMAEERTKADGARDPDYQARNWPRLEQGLRQVSTSYHRKVDEAVLGLALARKAERAPKMELGLAAEGVGEAYERTTLGDEAVRVELLKKARLAELKRSADPLLQLALRLRPLQRAADARRDAMAGKFLLTKPRYVEALQAFAKGELAPDANGTLRVTYGTVRGYRPKAEARPFAPFTRLGEVAAKSTGAPPFATPRTLLEAAADERKTRPYADPALGDVPVDFLADLHITGGNSGSAALNARGELVGLAFDGNYEAMASDWLFIPSITRSIQVDVRYVLWLLDAVFDGRHILHELGVASKLRQ